MSQIFEHDARESSRHMESMAGGSLGHLFARISDSENPWRSKMSKAKGLSSAVEVTYVESTINDGVCTPLRNA